MKKIITLTLIIAAFSSCYNMDSDASGETDEAKNEVKLKLDSMNNEMVVMGKQMEETLSKYDEEILKYLLENCEQKKVS